jgi:hypothetical protein
MFACVFEQMPALVYCCYGPVKWLDGVKAILEQKEERKININATNQLVRYFPCFSSVTVG